MQLVRTTVLWITCVLTGPLEMSRKMLGVWEEMCGERWMVHPIPQMGILSLSEEEEEGEGWRRRKRGRRSSGREGQGLGKNLNPLTLSCPSQY